MKILKLQNFIFCLVLSVLLSFVSPVVPALDSKDEVVKSIKQFELLYYCQPMRIIVEELHDDASKIKLTEMSIQTAIESRLRSARLYTSDPLSDYLYVRVGVGKSSYNIELSFNKRVQDLASEKIQRTPTWKTGSFGTHGENAGFVLSNLSQHMDNFLVEYLKVNEEYCD